MKNATIIHQIDSKELLQAVREIVREELLVKQQQPIKQPEQTTSKSQEIFNSEEASAYLRISRRTLYKRVKENKIQCSKDGVFLFTKEQLDNYLNNHKNK